MQDHLRSVPDHNAETPSGAEAASNGAGGGEQKGSRKRAQKRPSAGKALPTDRLKFDMQVSALKAIAVSSDNGKRAVSAEEMAPRMGVKASSSGLNNTFFTEMGLVTKEGKGRYKPTRTVCEFARKHTFSANEAGLLLGPTFRQSWPYKEIVKQSAMSTVMTKDQLVTVLADAAQASGYHKPQLLTVLDWLAYAGVIKFSGNVVTVVPTADGEELEASDEETTEKSPEPPTPEPIGAGATGTVTTTQRGRNVAQGATALAFSFDFSLTVDDLAKLTTEQIETLYESVGKVMALKARIADTPKPTGSS